MAQQQSSELLRVLGQLDDATWAETLLPLLKANKSAGSVALACKQLRRLCQRNQRKLKLEPGRYQQLHLSDLDAFSRPFPACSSVELTAAGDDDHLQLAIAVPMLARLPKLQSLRLCIQKEVTTAHMVLALQLLRLQLPQLRSLQLQLPSEESDGRQAWQVLGAATQLTKLVVENINPEFGEISLQHLSEIRPLGSSLQHLELDAGDSYCNNTLDCSFLSSFSSLTSLLLPLARHRPGFAASDRSGLATITSCTALQRLLFLFDGPQLDAAECAALAQLTRLTELALPASSDTPPCLEALRCLSGLQVLQLEHINSNHLPALATLTKLTRLDGHWYDDEPTNQAAEAAAATPGAPAATCPSVVQLEMSGPFPPAAFPGAKVVVVNAVVPSSRLVSISQHMPKLEAFGSAESADASSSFVHLSRAPEAERVAAVRSLGQLACLTRLAFGLNDDAEAAALAGAGAQLQHLGLHVTFGSRVTAQGLSSVLCRLSKLHTVNLLLAGLQLFQSEAKLLLAGISIVRKLIVRTGLARQQGQQVWEAAAAAARESGLPLPGKCSFE